MKKLLAAAILAALFTGASYAAEFEVLSVEFLSNATTNGSIGAIGDDVQYTLFKDLYAGMGQNLIAYGSVQSVFKWHIRYYADDDLEPSSMLAELDVTGHGYVESLLSGYPAPGSYWARAGLLDPFYTHNVQVGGSPFQIQYHGSTTDGSFGTAYAGTSSGWVQAGPRVWDGFIMYTVNSNMVCEAQYQPSVGGNGTARGFADLKVRMKVVKVGTATLLP